MSSGSLKNDLQTVYKSYIPNLYMYKQDLALDNL